jgi:hypothetical protein
MCIPRTTDVHIHELEVFNQTETNSSFQNVLTKYPQASAEDALENPIGGPKSGLDNYRKVCTVIVSKVGSAEQE